MLLGALRAANDYVDISRALINLLSNAFMEGVGRWVLTGCRVPAVMLKEYIDACMEHKHQYYHRPEAQAAAD